MSEIVRDENGRWVPGQRGGPGRARGHRTLREDFYRALDEETRQIMIRKQIDRGLQDPKHGLEVLRFIEGNSPKESKYDQPEFNGEVVIFDREVIVRTIEARAKGIGQAVSSLSRIARVGQEVDSSVASPLPESGSNGHGNGEH